MFLVGLCCSSFSFLCCVFCGVCDARLLVFCVVFLVGLCCSSFSFLCCVFCGGCVAHLFSFLCCVFCGVCDANLFSFLCCVFGGAVLLIFLVFCVVFLVGLCCSSF